MEDKLVGQQRTATVERETLETNIKVSVNLDGTGVGEFKTGVPFLEHMLDQIARHALIDLTVIATGDLEIDSHHTVEDIGITLGQAVATAVGDKRGIQRYGNAYVPLDESLSRVVLDLSGRSGLVYQVEYPQEQAGEFELCLLSEFFQGFVNHADITLHIDNIRGNNSHHIAETIFKAFGRALRMAVETDVKMAKSIPSTKGSL